MRLRISLPLTDTRLACGSIHAACCSRRRRVLREGERGSAEDEQSRREAGRLLTCLAQQTRVARLAVALQRLVACAVLAARHRGTLAAAASCPAYAAATLSRRLAVATRAVAATAAAG